MKDYSFNDYIREVDEEISGAVRRLDKERTDRVFVPYDSYVLADIKREIVDLMKSGNFPDASGVPLRVSIPPPNIETDITVSLFEYCKVARKSPARVAKEVALYINNVSSKLLIKSAESVDGYLNINLDQRAIYNRIIVSTIRLDNNYGESDVYKSKTVLIDYSSPNIAKPFGIGHLRSTVIGQALANLYYAGGFSVIRDNHLGDWGTQFGALLYAYEHWGDVSMLQKNPIETLKDLYVRFTAEASECPDIKNEARNLFMRLENGDKKLLTLWRKFRNFSLLEFDRVYKRLGIRFDVMVGESYYTKGGDELIKDLEKKGIAKELEDRAVVVQGLADLPSFLLRKSDGSTLYVLRDILALIHRNRVFRPDIILYVVGSEQKLNFQQFFSVCRKAGYVMTTELKHVDFGLVLLSGAKMSTRKGTAINLENVLDQIIEKSKKILLQKGKFEEEKMHSIAEVIGINALIYNDLRKNRSGNVDFDLDRMLSFESGSAVYLQYTYARIVSVLAKAKDEETAIRFDYNLCFKNSLEFKLAMRLAFLPDIILRSIENNAPHMISVYLEDLATEFNRFYSEVAVLQTEHPDLKKSRLLLLRAVSIVIRNALRLFNIQVLDKI